MHRPWFIEDNKVSFTSDGLNCHMCRGPLGTWCGYVGIPKSHPWYGKSYSAEVKPSPEMLTNRHENDHGSIDLFCAMLSETSSNESLSISLCMRVHGGLTYANDHHPYAKPDGLWWFGFDCAHFGDLVPVFAEQFDRLQILRNNEVYRDQQYVVAECQSLAAQLVKIGTNE